MLLTIDVGNTNISCGLFNGDDLVATFRFTTMMTRTPDEISLQLHSILEVKKINEADIKDVIISSVVPNINNDLVHAVEECFNTTPLLIGPGVKTGLAITIDDPKSCGADLIVDCVAAYQKYQKECLVIDFGTATKFLYVSDNCEFKYGIISPGLEGMANTLWKNTAQLPQVSLKKPNSVLATNTVSSMQAGILYGYIGLTEGIINQIKKEIGHDFAILATGGLGRYICHEIKGINEYEPNLAYYGMKYIYERNRG